MLIVLSYEEIQAGESDDGDTEFLQQWRGRMWDGLNLILQTTAGASHSAASGDVVVDIEDTPVDSELEEEVQRSDQEARDLEDQELMEVAGAWEREENAAKAQEARELGQLGFLRRNEQKGATNKATSNDVPCHSCGANRDNSPGSAFGGDDGDAVTHDMRRSGTVQQLNEMGGELAGEGQSEGIA